MRYVSVRILQKLFHLHGCMFLFPCRFPVLSAWRVAWPLLHSWLVRHPGNTQGSGHMLIFVYVCVYFLYNSVPGVCIFESKNTLNIESKICVIAKPVLRTESLLTSTLLSVSCKEHFIMCSRGLTSVVFEDNHLCHFCAHVCALPCVLQHKNILSFVIFSKTVTVYGFKPWRHLSR